MLNVTKERTREAILEGFYAQIKEKNGFTHFFSCTARFNDSMDIFSEALECMQEKGYEIVDVKMTAHGDNGYWVHIMVLYK